jgi:putative endonuclease
VIPERLKRARIERGGRARDAGRWAEVVAAAWLMAKGWRILGFRLKTRMAEIDLLARRGAVLAVIEVKSRTTIEAALGAVTADQAARLRRAGAAVAAGRPDLKGLSIRLDMVALAPGRRPRHIVDAWAPTGDQIRRTRRRR